MNNNFNFGLLLVFGLLVIIAISFLFIAKKTERTEFKLIAYTDSILTHQGNTDSSQMAVNAPEFVNSSPKLYDYKVEKNLTLFSIAKRFNTTVTQLIELNNLTSSSINEGDKLKIPVTDITVVQIGETVAYFSRKYNIKISLIKRANNLTDDKLSAGQKIIIPIK